MFKISCLRTSTHSQLNYSAPQRKVRGTLIKKHIEQPRLFNETTNGMRMQTEWRTFQQALANHTPTDGVARISEMQQLTAAYAHPLVRRIQPSIHDMQSKQNGTIRTGWSKGWALDE